MENSFAEQAALQKKNLLCKNKKKKKNWGVAAPVFLVECKKAVRSFFPSSLFRKRLKSCFPGFLTTVKKAELHLHSAHVSAAHSGRHAAAAFAFAASRNDVVNAENHFRDFAGGSNGLCFHG